MEVVLPSGNIVTVNSNQHSDKEIKNIILVRQEIAANYCNKMGWPFDPLKLTFEQIIEIRNLDEWQNASKKLK